MSTADAFKNAIVAKAFMVPGDTVTPVRIKDATSLTEARYQGIKKIT